jgi:hypothetical protein
MGDLGGEEIAPGFACRLRDAAAEFAALAVLAEMAADREAPPLPATSLVMALSHYRIFDAGNFASLKSRRGDGFVPCLHRRGPEGSVRFA